MCSSQFLGKMGSGCKELLVNIISNIVPHFGMYVLLEKSFPFSCVLDPGCMVFESQTLKKPNPQLPLKVRIHVLDTVPIMVV